MAPQILPSLQSACSLPKLTYVVNSKISRQRRWSRPQHMDYKAAIMQPIMDSKEPNPGGHLFL